MRLLRTKSLVAAAAIGAGALAAAGPSGAVALVAGSGWQSDTVSSPGANSLNSPVTFTVAAGDSDIFSLTDALGLKDTYTVTINGGVTAMSTVSSYPTSFDNTTGPAAATAGPAWSSTDTSHLQLDFAPGTYSLAIASNCSSGACPVNFADRLDLATIAPVPEPATWAVMMLGFGGLGVSIRRRRRQSLTATA